jgi:hypothetical protein
MAQIARMHYLVLRFYVYSIIDIYGSVKRITFEAKSQMELDIKTIFLTCKKFVQHQIESLETYALKFFDLVTFDEPTALNNLVSHLGTYPLRLLKNFYLFSSKDGQQLKSLTGSSYVVKTEKLVTIFELSRACLLSLVEDQKIVAEQDFSNGLVEIVVAGNEQAKSNTAN